MAKIDICELSDIFQNAVVEKHPFAGRGVSDLVKLGYRFGCMVSYLPEAQNDTKFIADMRGVVAGMLDIADKNVGDNTIIVLPMMNDNPMAKFINDVVLKHFPKQRFEFLTTEYQIKNPDNRQSAENILREGVRGVVPAFPRVQ